MEKTRMVINTASGPIYPISPGKFIESIRQTMNKPIETSVDDMQFSYSGIEAGSFDDLDSPLKFKTRQVKVKEIYDVDLLSSEESREYRKMAITHFGIKELSKFTTKIKNTFQTDGDMTVDLIQDLSLEFMKEMGSDGHLILMKQSVILVSVEDFSMELFELYKKHIRTKMMCGALFCSRPFRVKKATFGGRLVLR